MRKVLPRIGVCALLAVPLCLVWEARLFTAVVVGFVLAAVLYLGIQAMTQFRHPLHGALSVTLFAVAYAVVAPTMSAVKHHAFSSDALRNYPVAANPATAFNFPAGGQWRGIAGPAG